MLSGPASIVLSALGSLATAGALGDRARDVPWWVWWAAAGVCFFFCCFRVWQREHEAHKLTLERLRPKLEISSVPQKFELRWRIKVRNLSKTTVRFGAKLERINPGIGSYQVPARLQITGTEPPYREGDIPGEGEAWVDVLTEAVFESETEVGLLSAEEPSEDITIPKVDYVMRVCVFPVSEGYGGEARHRFYYTRIPSGVWILSDAGAFSGDP